MWHRRRSRRRVSLLLMRTILPAILPRGAGAVALLLTVARPAVAQQPVDSSQTARAPSPAPAPAPAPALSGDTLKVTPLGYVEAFYQWNFSQPSNGISNYVAFDNRHNSFTLANVALGASMDYGPLTSKLVLQIGHTPNTYYLSEPASPGAAGAGGTDASTWKYLQEANFGWKAPVGNGLLFQMGLFLSPIGPESLAVKDSWNWSRSNLFFGLPFYHTGLRATYDLGRGWSATAAVYNGWNSVVDNNSDKTFSGSVAYKQGIVTAQALYMGGNERPTGAPEGAPWRHLFDAYTQLDVATWMSLIAHADAGFESNNFGTSDWYAGALSARVQPASWLYLSARGDHFHEDVASNAHGTATAIFWPATWVESGTFTIDTRPHDNLSVRLEYRHDQAAANMFFNGAVPGNGATNSRSQDTLTLGATAWF